MFMIFRQLGERRASTRATHSRPDDDGLGPSLIVGLKTDDEYCRDCIVDTGAHVKYLCICIASTPLRSVLHDLGARCEVQHGDTAGTLTRGMCR